MLNSSIIKLRVQEIENYIQIGRKFKSSKIEFELNNLRSVEFLNNQMKSSKDRNLNIQIG